jgi:hypothetical protein
MYGLHGRVLLLSIDASYFSMDENNVSERSSPRTLLSNPQRLNPVVGLLWLRHRGEK